MTMTDAAAPRGLKGVIVADTALGDVRGLEGFYHYRQYSAPELAAKPHVRGRVVPALRGRPADARTRATSIRPASRAARHLPAAVLDAAPGDGRRAGTPPLAALRTALVALSRRSRRCPPTYDADPRDDPRRRAAPVRGDAGARRRAVPRVDRRVEPIAPRDDLGTAANYLYMIDGEVPEPARARAIEQYLILAIDHGFNASTFTARVIASTGADVGAAVVAALGALSGPLHGGAPSRALDTLDAIGTPENTEAWVRRAVAGGERIMGFGHAVYRTADPRSVMLREIAQSLGGPLVDFAVQVEAARRTRRSPS